MLGDPASYDAVWRIVVATPALFMALNDLITGIILPHQGARIAGQILEVMISSNPASPDGLKPKQKWPHMRQNLRIEEAYLKFISTLCHGTKAWRQESYSTGDHARTRDALVGRDEPFLAVQEERWCTSTGIRVSNAQLDWRPLKNVVLG